MAANEITDNNKRGMQGVYSGTTNYNATQAQIEKALNGVNTTYLGKVESCATSEGASGAKTVNVTPLTAQVDGNGNAVGTPTYQSIPHYRVQAGIAALIINPVAGDIGVFSCAKRDISNISQGTSATQVPGSFRSFSPADSVMVGTVHTKEPEVYIELKQDKTILVHAPDGFKLETDSDCEIEAGGDVKVTASNVVVKASSVTIDATETTITGHLTVQGGMAVSGGTGASVSGNLSSTGTIHADQNIDSSSDVLAGSVSLSTHVHSGVQAGGANTGAPVA